MSLIAETKKPVSAPCAVRDDQASRLIEITTDRALGRVWSDSLRAMAVAPLIMVLFAVVWHFFQPTLPLSREWVGLAVGLGIIWGTPCNIAYHHLSARLVARFRRMNGDHLAGRLASAMHGYCSAGAQVDLRQLARDLYARGERGLIVIVRTRDEPPLGAPIDVPFEPRPLEHVETILADDEPWNELVKRDAEARNQRMWRWAALAMIAGALAIAWLVWRRGPWFGVTPLMHPAFVGVLTASVLGPLFLFRHWRWLVVPGGLAKLHCVWWATTWQVRLFKRSVSVIFVAPYHRGSHVVAIASGQGCESIAVASEAAYIFLRAYRSPLEPPNASLLENSS